MKKLNSLGELDFPPGSEAKIIFKKCRDSIKRAVTLVKIQIARKASHHLPLLYMIFYMFLSLCKGT